MCTSGLRLEGVLRGRVGARLGQLGAGGEAHEVDERVALAALLRDGQGVRANVAVVHELRAACINIQLS